MNRKYFNTFIKKSDFSGNSNNASSNNLKLKETYARKKKEKKKEKKRYWLATFFRLCWQNQSPDAKHLFQQQHLVLWQTP